MSQTDGIFLRLLLMTLRDIVMAAKPTYSELERKIKNLEMVDFIPPACQHPEITCARIIFDGYEFTTKKFLETSCKLSFNITVSNKQIGQLEVFRLEKKSELEKALFLEEEKNLIGAIAESISRIVEREGAEAEIRKCRKKIEELIKNH